LTAQTTDSLLFKGRKYELFAAQGTGLPHPQDFGISPRPLSSGCWRGFYRGFKTRKGQLFLDRLTVRDAEESYPSINGVGPTEVCRFSRVYRNLNLPVGFTGLLKVGRDLCRSPVWPTAEDFRTVLAISFDGGRVTGIRDRSEEQGGRGELRFPEAQDFEILDQLCRDLGILEVKAL